MHAQGIIHGDIKPSNVLLTRQGQVKLSDLGIARTLDALRTGRLTESGTIVGTIDYLAPEQLAGQDVTTATDVYSLGLLLLEACTGDRPFGDRSSSAEIDALSSEVLPGWYEDWVIVEAEAWRGKRLHALETLADDLRGDGSFGQALIAAQAAIDGDPLRESPRRALIRIHMAEGNVSDAIQEFTRYRELLKRELGLEPTPRLQALLEQDR